MLRRLRPALAPGLPTGIGWCPGDDLRHPGGTLGRTVPHNRTTDRRGRGARLRRARAGVGVPAPDDLHAGAPLPRGLRARPGWYRQVAAADHGPEPGRGGGTRPAARWPGDRADPGGLPRGDGPCPWSVGSGPRHPPRRGPRARRPEACRARARRLRAPGAARHVAAPEPAARPARLCRDDPGRSRRARDRLARLARMGQARARHAPLAPRSGRFDHHVARARPQRTPGGEGQSLRERPSTGPGTGSERHRRRSGSRPRVRPPPARDRRATRRAPRWAPRTPARNARGGLHLAARDRADPALVAGTPVGAGGVRRAAAPPIRGAHAGGSRGPRRGAGDDRARSSRARPGGQRALPSPRVVVLRGPRPPAGARATLGDHRRSDLPHPESGASRCVLPGRCGRGQRGAGGAT